MSTHDIPDNELDGFFKKSLEEPDIDFREEDWLQMEKKLDGANRQKAIFRRYFYSLLVLLLIGTIGSVVWWMNHTRPDANVETAVLPEASVHKGSPISSDRSKETSRNTEPEALLENQKTAKYDVPDRNTPEETIAVQEGKPEAEKEVSQENTLTPDPAYKNQNGKEELTGITANTYTKLAKEGSTNSRRETNKPETAQIPWKSISKNREPIGTEIYADPGERTTTSAKKVRSKSKNPFTLSTSGQSPRANAGNKPSAEKGVDGGKPQTMETDQWIIAGAPMAEPGAEFDATDATYGEADINWPVLPATQLPVKLLAEGGLRADSYAKELNKLSISKPGTVQTGDSIEVKRLAKERINYRYSISVLLSPDISAVRLSGLTKPGTNIGILLNYRFSPKISISTGLIRSAKIYDARTEDYSPPPGQWTYYIKPVEIKATCTVLDIPLNIRYTLLDRDKYSLYAVAGLSSYLMLSEHYRYIYDVDDSHLRKYWQVNNQNKHFFKVYNLSAGYERKLGRRISASAEPFLKIPGAGVGFGKIHLWSAGMFISAKYQIGK